MDAPNVNHIPPMQYNENNPGVMKSDISHLPTSQMPSGLPPSYPVSSQIPLYPTQGPPPLQYAGPPPLQYAAPQYPHMYPSSPVIMTQMQMPYQGVIVASNFIPPQTIHIRDYMVWSIVNIFLGGLILGFIGVFLSTQTKRRKREGDVHGATTMSRITLAFNILTTLAFFALSAFLIIYYIFVISVLYTT